MSPNPKKHKTTILIIIITSTAIACQITLPGFEVTNPPSTTIEQITPTVSSFLFTPTAIQIIPSSPTPRENFNQASAEEGLNTETGQTPTPLSTFIPTSIPQTILVYLQPQSPVYIVNFLHPELGCTWSGVAGQIFNSAGEPVNGLIVEISGQLHGNPFLGLGLTGTSLPIGPGGYEIQLSDKPLESNQSLSLRIFDQQGNQLNETLPLITYNDCQKNLIIINFTLLNQPFKEKIYFPIISR